MFFDKKIYSVNGRRGWKRARRGSEKVVRGVGEGRKSGILLCKKV